MVHRLETDLFIQQTPEIGWFNAFRIIIDFLLLYIHMLERYCYLLGISMRRMLLSFAVRGLSLFSLTSHYNFSGKINATTDEVHRQPGTMRTRQSPTNSHIVLSI